MSRRLVYRPHFEETHLRACTRRLPRCLHARETTTNDVNCFHF
jgi:hypothetical protein